ncbi:MAG: GntG family PLP-dependent aldolase [Acidimicrobiia bacterium]|nr:MAG: GntG family PLP-dependent aldolase [Acidimicrobiia bacterium]
MIDLRSDTVTRPSPAMREAIAKAPVGDDLYGDDPSVNALEERVAALLGKQEAMYVPTGTMSNMIAVRLHTQPGDSVVLEESGHIGTHEMGGAAHHSGVTLKRIQGNLGVFSADDLRSRVPTPHPSLPSHLYEPHTLVALENTHNAAGGTIWPLETMDEVVVAARELSMATHLDGARIWNASAATGIPLDRYAAQFDTVSVCFSKGLGAPVGSALAGDHALISVARRFKQLFGGGFRQAGIIAAGALYALENNQERVAEDHANARTFAGYLADREGIAVDLETVQTNMVYFTVSDPAFVVDRCLENGVAMLVDDGRIRVVFHLDVSKEDTAVAMETVASAVAEAR